jgi:putative peptidoglycan lipid II flippase
MTLQAVVESERGSEVDRNRTVAFVRNSFTGSVWTIVSRGTGLAQSIAVATVLGATYLGNTYQAINALPNIVYYQLLAGSLFASILVPPLVSKRDAGDEAGLEAVARGFFGTLLLAGVALCLVLLLAGPLILHGLTLGVANPATAAAQRRVGLLFLVLFVPQILLYVTAGTGGAVMNSFGRFALAAGAPALENLGMISTLIACAVLFGAGAGLVNVTTPEVLLLGLGTTASVGVHAAAQWFGARSVGIRLVPRAGWRDPELRQILRRVFPTLCYTGLAASQTVVVLAIANRLAGGLVGFQLALNFYFVPIAIVTWPVARSMLPHLSVLAAKGEDRAFWDELCRAVRLASFVVVPMAVAYVALATPIARAIAIGQLQADGGAPLVAASVSALGIGVVGETWFILGTYAFYARQNARAPLRSMVVRVSVALACMSGAVLAHNLVILLALGLAMSIGSVVGSIHLWWRLRPMSHGGLIPLGSLMRAVGASLAMAVPATITAWSLSGRAAGHEPGEIFAVAAAAIVGACTYLAVQRAWGAPELALLRLGTGGLARRRGR